MHDQIKVNNFYDFVRTKYELFKERFCTFYRYYQLNYFDCLFKLYISSLLITKFLLLKLVEPKQLMINENYVC